MPGKYATTTNVTSDASVGEIQRILRRYGATAFMQGWDAGSAIVGFEIHDRKIVMTIPMPHADEHRFTHTPSTGKERAATAREREYEQAIRQVWRALALVIKAKLEAVAAGITTIEQEFLAHILMPDGYTVGQHALPKIAEAYATNTTPALLPGPTGRR